MPDAFIESARFDMSSIDVFGSRLGISRHRFTSAFASASRALLNADADVDVKISSLEVFSKPIGIFRYRFASARRVRVAFAERGCRSTHHRPRFQSNEPFAEIWRTHALSSVLAQPDASDTSTRTRVASRRKVAMEIPAVCVPWFLNQKSK